MRPRGQKVPSLAQSGMWATTVHLEARPVPGTTRKLRARTQLVTSGESNQITGGRLKLVSEYSTSQHP